MNYNLLLQIKLILSASLLTKEEKLHSRGLRINKWVSIAISLYSFFVYQRAVFSYEAFFEEIKILVNLYFNDSHICI